MSKLVPPNTCHRPSVAALACQSRQTGTKGGGHQRQLKQVSRPQKSQAVVPSQPPPTQWPLLLPEKETDSHTASFPQDQVQGSRDSANVAWPERAAPALDLTTVSLFSKGSAFPAGTSPSYLRYKGPMAQTAFLIPHPESARLLNPTPTPARSPERENDQGLETEEQGSKGE